MAHPYGQASVCVQRNYITPFRKKNQGFSGRRAKISHGDGPYVHTGFIPACFFIGRGELSGSGPRSAVDAVWSRKGDCCAAGAAHHISLLFLTALRRNFPWSISVFRRAIRPDKLSGISERARRIDHKISFGRQWTKRPGQDCSSIDNYYY